jgi:hypothetical protein
MCTCFSKIQDQLRERTGDSTASIPARVNFGFKIKQDGSPDFVIPIPCLYRPKKKNGEFRQITGGHLLFHAGFCPFCGEKL